ncbi:hypothetical protein [Microvirga tunisiensis]|uniref:hypothetical protein n=1 Tax=Microvirga tunisiensis TaxID=2108360 RepID=UPI001386FE90
MAKIKKMPVKNKDSSYRDRAAGRRRNDLDRSAALTEHSAIKRLNKYNQPHKQKKYAKDVEILGKVYASTRGEVSYSIFGNKRLRIDKPGELTRERGIFRKTRKTLKHGTEPGTVYVRKYEKESWRKKRSYNYDENGKLLSQSIVRKDGSFRENWERDEKDQLIRTSYYTNRIRDGGYFRSISEELSKPDKNGYRTLTRKKGSNEKVFERDADGNLTLIGRKSRSVSKYSRTSADRRTARTDIRHFGGMFSKSYESLLDKDGAILSKDIRSVRRLWNKRSAEYDDSGQLDSTKHTFGKLYKSRTKYIGEETKLVTRRLLGIKLGTKLKALSEGELDAQKLRAEEAKEHAAVWEARTFVYPLPEPGTTRRLGALQTPNTVHHQGRDVTSPPATDRQDIFNTKAVATPAHSRSNSTVVSIHSMDGGSTQSRASNVSTTPSTSSPSRSEHQRTDQSVTWDAEAVAEEMRLVEETLNNLELNPESKLPSEKRNVHQTKGNQKDTDTERMFMDNLLNDPGIRSDDKAQSKACDERRSRRMQQDTRSTDRNDAAAKRGLDDRSRERTPLCIAG